MTDERRLEYRLSADMIIDKVESCQENSPRFQGSIRELSASGCRIQSSVELEVDQEFKISFTLEGGHRIECVQVKVVRRLSHRSHKVVAVEFVNLAEEDQFYIREFIVWKEAQEEVK